MNGSGDSFRNMQARHLRVFDNQITEFRDVYGSLSAEEREEICEWLKATAALSSKCPYNWYLQVKVEHDDFDDDGEKVGEWNVTFTPATLLNAMESWGKGEPYAPDQAWP